VSNPPAATSRRPRRMRRALLAAAACVALYGAIGFLAAPPLLRPEIEKRAAAFLGRPVSLARLRLNPFALSATADGLEIRDRDGAPLLQWDRLYLNFEAAASLFRHAWVFHAIHLSGAGVRLAMAPDGTLNIDDILAAAGGGATPGAPPAPPPALRVHRLLVEDTTLSFVDRSPGETFTTTLGPLRLDLSDFTTRSDENNAYTFAGRTEAGESFSWKGQFALGPPRSEGEFTLEAVTLGKYHPYYRGTVPFDVRRGTADVHAGYRVAWGPTDRELRLKDASVTLHDVQLSEHGKEEIAVDAPVLEVEKGNLDLLNGAVAIGRIATRGGHILLRQRQDGHVNLLDMLLPFFAEPTTGPSSAQTAAGSQATKRPAARQAAVTTPGAPPAATISLAEVTFADYTVDAEDLTPPRPVRLRLDQIHLKLLGVDNVAGTTEKASLDLRWNGGGTVHADGDLSLVGLVGDLNVRIDAIDVGPLDPYVQPSLDLRITSGSFSADGRSHADLTDPNRIEFSFQGDARMDDFASVDGARRGDLLRWKNVRLAKVDYSLRQDRMRIGDLAIAAPEVVLSRAADGWINLLAALHMAQLTPGGEPGAEPSAPVTSGTPATPPSDSGDTRIAHARLSGGRIRLRDDAVAPPVVVALTKIDGTLAGLSSRPGARADVHIKALFDDTAPVALDGQVDPLGADVFTDLALVAHGIDLGPLGPYAGKYLGYGLDRGRIDVDMRYRLESRALDGANLFVAKPFLLGDKVESPDATHLPVRLGLALLRDRNGEIRLDVPVQGSLDDPAFRLGRVILHAIVNVFTKLVTSPFTLLARAFAGKEVDLSVVEFPPGTASLTDESRSRLDALAKGMTERPGLTLSMTGGADPNLDPDALCRGRVENLIRTEKWRTLRKSEREAMPAESVVVAPDERPRYLKAAWKTMRQNQPAAAGADATNPPAPKPETPEEMEAWMLERTTIGPADLSALAGERARAVRDRLAASGIESARLFLKAGDATPSARVTLELQ
jgi:Domain of Unknown Function (DUF748)